MSEEFDEVAYLKANPDVQALVERGAFRSGLDHWRIAGAEEHARGLRPSGFFDYDLMYNEALYLAQNEDVARAVRNGELLSGYQHWNRIGRHEFAEGRRAAQFSRVTAATLQFRVPVGDSGSILAAAITTDLDKVTDARLHIDGTATVVLDPMKLACTERLQFQDERGNTTGVRLLLIWAPDQHPASARHSTLSVTSKAVGTCSMSLHDGSQQAPFFFATLDDVQRFLLAARRITTQDALRGREMMSAVVEFVRGHYKWEAAHVRDESLVNAHVENLICVEGAGFYAQGWLIPTSASIERCRVLCLDTGEMVEIHGAWARSHRPDVAESFRDKLGGVSSDLFGFAAFAAMPLGSRSPGSRLVFGITPKGGPEYVTLPAVPNRPKSFVDAIRVVLSGLDPSSAEFCKNLETCAGPALQGLWVRERATKSRAITTREFGPRPAEPRATVVIPVYGRYDFIKYQLALFANDEDFSGGKTEVIYFIDDPRIIDAVCQLCTSVYSLYRVPVVVAYTGGNHGFSGANNLGASIARGSVLVLLNSDVMPKRPGWIKQLLTAHAQLPDCGILGAKLLYHDESLQHDGMVFEKFPFWGGLYGNNHPGKGLPNRDETKSPAREVEAVTGACLAMSAAFYRELGGMSEEFVIGDFEDSELCLRVWAAGKRVYYLPGVELYHLERQSQPLLPDGGSWQWQLSAYNAWVQNKKHGHFIDELKRNRSGNGRPKSSKRRSAS